MLDYTAITDRLRTVSWTNHRHPTGVANQLKGSQPLHYLQQPYNQKGHVFKTNRPYRTEDQLPTNSERS